MAYRDQRMNCPRCNHELAREGEGWRCGSCRGVLLEQRLLGDAVELVPVEPRGAPIGCPACTTRMLAFGVMGVDVERCEKDALVWFDGGELGFLKAYLEADEPER